MRPRARPATERSCPKPPPSRADRFHCPKRNSEPGATAMVERINCLVHSAAFNRFILSMIVLSGVLVGFETYPAFSEQTAPGRAIHIVQQIILWVFVGEIVLKIAACGNRPWEYFRQGWNLFDFAIVAVCFL